MQLSLTMQVMISNHSIPNNHTSHGNRGTAGVESRDGVWQSLSDWAALFRIALLTFLQTLKIVCFTMASGDSNFVVKLLRKTKWKCSSLAHAVCQHCWIQQLQTDQKEELHWSPKNKLAPSLTQQHKAIHTIWQGPPHWTWQWVHLLKQSQQQWTLRICNQIPPCQETYKASWRY